MNWKITSKKIVVMLSFLLTKIDKIISYIELNKLLWYTINDLRDKNIDNNTKKKFK